MDKMNYKIDKNRFDSIMGSEARVAVDLTNIEADRVVDEEYYNVETTKSENAFLDIVLDTNIYMDMMGLDDRRELEYKKSRNNSHLLVNDHKWYAGDSDLMENVKSSVIDLEKRLATRFESDRDTNEAKEKYKDAIKACEDYIAAKNPWFSTGKRRKKEVQERLNRLKEEQRWFEWGVDVVKNQLTDQVANTGLDYLTIGQRETDKILDYGTSYKAHFTECFDFAHADASIGYACANPETRGEMEFKDKPLSAGAEKFFNDFYQSQDLIEAIHTNKKTDRWKDYQGVDKKDKDNYMNFTIIAQVDETYKMIHDNEQIYNQNKAVIDKLFGQYEQEMRSLDALSFMIPLLQTRKNKIEDDDVWKEVDEKLDYYYQFLQVIQAMAGQHLDVIKKLMKNQPLEPKDIEHTDMINNLDLVKMSGIKLYE
ncbi:MAG: hypothetical protein J6N76_05315 [Lachnospiraceae bacterium]|nr:hypothetical protein [Lachnospiraceae bacterium]